MIELHDISYTYPRATVPALRQLSASFAAGCVTALTGPNGSGKTTLAQLITGMFKPTQGSIIIDGQDIRGQNLFAISRRIGYIRQNPNRQLFCPSVREELEFGLQHLGLNAGETAERCAYWLELFHLQQQADAPPLLLSLGEKQRLALACVLSLGAPWLLLDEPTGGLDLRSRRLLGQQLQELAESGHGIIVISHERDFIRRYCGEELSLC